MLPSFAKIGFSFILKLFEIFALNVLNRSFPSSKNPHFQNEAKCETFVLKMSFICRRIKNRFQINGVADNLEWKQRFRVTQKWPII